MRAQIRRPKRETAAAGAAPAGEVRSLALGRLRDPPWGYYGPCARSSLTAQRTASPPGYASADRSWANAERHSPEPQQSVERRAGLRYWPVISERSRRWTRPRGGSRGAAIRTSACRRSAPLIFLRERKTDEGTAPCQSGLRSVG
jgi:hypothetical protein